jgi:serine/threonine protein kinase
MLGCLIVELIVRKRLFHPSTAKTYPASCRFQTESRPHCDIENMIDACRLVTESGKIPPIPEEFAVPEDLRKLIGLCCVWRPEGRISAQEVVRILSVLTTTSEELSSKLARASITVDSTAVKVDSPLVREEALKKHIQPTGAGVFRLGAGGAGEVLLVEWNGSLAAKKQLKGDRCDRRYLGVSILILTTKIFSSLDVRSTESLAAELRVFLDIQHPNLLKLHAACFTATEKFLVLEYLSQGDLSTLIHSTAYRDELAWTRRGRDIALQIARGLLALHTNSCVHRDIKTSNVLVGGDWKAKISDFGQSKLKTGSRDEMEQTSTPSGERQRSAAYASPEQLSDTAPVLFPSDIYSFGVVLWEIYTQKSPFSGKTMIQVLLAISSGRTLELPGTMPALLRYLISTCWKADPAERPTAQDCVDILQELATENPSSVRMLSGGEESLLGTKTRRRVREARIFPINVINAVAAAAEKPAEPSTIPTLSRNASRGSKSAGPFAPLNPPEPIPATSTTAPAMMSIPGGVPSSPSPTTTPPSGSSPVSGRNRGSVAPAPVVRESSGNWNSAFLKQRQLNQIATLQTEMTTTPAPGGEGSDAPLSPPVAEIRPGIPSPEGLAHTRSRRILNGSILPSHLEGSAGSVSLQSGTSPSPSPPLLQASSPTLGSGPLPPVKNDQIVVSKNFIIVVKGATIERLVNQLCTSAKLETPFGDNFRELFLLTYRSLMRPADLFGSIVAKMNSAHSGQLGASISLSRSKKSASSTDVSSTETQVAETRIRLASVLQDWLTRHHQDFDSSLKQDLYRFMNAELSELTTVYDQLVLLAERGPATYHDLASMQFSAGIIPRNPASYEDYDATEIARQLCLIQHTHFVSLLSHELVYSHRAQPPTPAPSSYRFPL